MEEFRFGNQSRFLVTAAYVVARLYAVVCQLSQLLFESADTLGKVELLMTNQQ
jgi:hypothetical protein